MARQTIQVEYPDRSEPPPTVKMSFTAHYGILYGDGSSIMAMFSNVDNARLFIETWWRDRRSAGFRKPSLVCLDTGENMSWFSN